jgi:hypothetical protein
MANNESPLFSWPGLALVSVQDGHLSSVKCIAVYRVSTPQQVAVWDAEHGDVSCTYCSLIIRSHYLGWFHRLVDVGGKVKQLVVAICVERPGWQDLCVFPNMRVVSGAN